MQGADLAYRCGGEPAGGLSRGKEKGRQADALAALYPKATLSKDMMSLFVADGPVTT
jgi:hypothetical protein